MSVVQMRPSQYARRFGRSVTWPVSSVVNKNTLLFYNRSVVSFHPFGCSLQCLNAKKDLPGCQNRRWKKFLVSVRVCVSNLGDEWQQHAKDDNRDISLGHRGLSKWRIKVTINHGFFMGTGRLDHGVHSDISDLISKDQGRML